MLGLCMFVVCLQLQQCIRYGEYFEQHIGDHPLDMFYYSNPTGLEPEPYQYDLRRMLLMHAAPRLDADATPEDTHSAALEWLAYYHYRYNSSCTRLLKFEQDVAFAEPQGFDYMAQFEADIAAHAGDTLLLYRRDCQQAGESGFSVVLDKTAFTDLLDFYMLNAALSPDQPVQGLEAFLQDYARLTGEQHVARIERMYVDCIGAEQWHSEHWSFVHCDGVQHPLCQAGFATPMLQA